MIFRKKTDPVALADTPLQRIHNRIASEPALRLSILDVSIDKSALIVLCSDSRMNTIVKMALEKHWLGVVEVFCATDLIMGGGEEQYGCESSPSRYLN